MNADHRREQPGFLILGMSPRQLSAAAVGILTTGTLVVGVIVNAVHNAAQQVKVIRDELQQNPPTTRQDLDRLQQRVTDTTRNIRQDVRDQIDQIEPAAPEPAPIPTPKPLATPKTAIPAPPTPRATPTPTPRILPPLPPLLP